MTGYREKALAEWDGYCERCGGKFTESSVEVHHTDRDHSNDSLDNLDVVCRACHHEEHHGTDRLWGLLVSVPRPVLEMVDEAVERHGYGSRAEAVNRALVAAYAGEGDSVPRFSGPEESVEAWFGGGDHERWDRGRAVPPDGDSTGGPKEQP